MRLLTCALLGRIAPSLLWVQKERETSLQATRGGCCCWRAARSHLPGLDGAGCGEEPLCIPPAVPLHGMKAVGELLPRAVCAGSLCCALWFAAVPFGTPGAAQSSVWDQLPSGCSMASADLEAGWSWVIPVSQPRTPTPGTLQQLWGLLCSHPQL